LKAEIETQARVRAAFLLQCNNAVLTNNEFCYRSDDEVFENSWLISDMTMALVKDNGSLEIIFKDETRREFILGVDIWTKASATGILLFGGIGTMIAGKLAIDNQIKATSQQWASVINVLISKGKLPEMIYCKSCGAKNKSMDSKCFHCGAIFE